MHSCPECDQACYCGGDIDDIDAGDEEAQDNCTHCEGDHEDDEFCENDDLYDDNVPEDGDA